MFILNIYIYISCNRLRAVGRSLKGSSLKLELRKYQGLFLFHCYHKKRGWQGLEDYSDSSLLILSSTHYSEMGYI